LSPEAITYLTDQVRSRVQQDLPIMIIGVVPAQDIQRGDPGAILKLGKDHGFDTVLVAVFSSAESEVPRWFPLDGAPEQGGTRPGVSGFETVNYARVELALLDVKADLVVATANGQAWTSLYHLYAPVQSNSYPVIHRSLRIAPIYPPQGHEKDMLRIVAGDEALEQAVLDFQRQLKAAMNG
jgi:hypothetical protein